MTRHLTVEQALRIARTAVGGPIEVRDIGLLESAVHRPRASVLGQDAYPDLFTKAAALLHSLAGNHPLVDGNNRLAWLATYVFLAKNGVELDPVLRAEHVRREPREALVAVDERVVARERMQ